MVQSAPQLRDTVDNLLWRHVLSVSLPQQPGRYDKLYNFLAIADYAVQVVVNCLKMIAPGGGAVSISSRLQQTTLLLLFAHDTDYTDYFQGVALLERRFQIQG